MSEKIYIEKINSTIDFIRNNLGRKLSLEEISDAAGLSKFHFHRIFHAFTDESLYETIVRLSIEKAAETLLTDSSVSIANLALASGFEDATGFSAAFKKRFSISPSGWRKNKNKTGHQGELEAAYPAIRPGKKVDGEVKALSFEIRKLDGFSIAFIRHTGAYAGDSSLFIYLYNKLTSWAASKNLLTPECENIVVYNDPTEITDDNRLRISLGISVPETTKTGGDFDKMQLQGGEYLVCRYRLRDDQYGTAWNQVYRYWLPKLGLLPADGHCFELYPNKIDNPDKYSSIVDICVPVISPTSR
ncbi:MAG: AraC family transcriptional regulator [Spirochaetales bacterium]|nr:AraC family transcriptional regulator [Spirochaetales bacterium]